MNSTGEFFFSSCLCICVYAHFYSNFSSVHKQFVCTQSIIAIDGTENHIGKIDGIESLNGCMSIYFMEICESILIYNGERQRYREN